MRAFVLVIALVFVMLSLPYGVEAPAVSPSLILASVKISPSQVMVGSVFVTEMLVINVGSLTALTAELNLDLVSITGTPLAIVGSGTHLNIGSLLVRENITLRAVIAVSSDASPAIYDVPYTLTYSDANKYSYSNSGTFGVTVAGTPDVEVQSVTVDPPKLTPTVDGTLSLSFINVGTETANDLTVRIYNDGGLLTSTVTYIGQLARDAVKTIAFGIHVDTNAPTGTRLLNITLAYRDPSGKPYANWKVYDLKVYDLLPLIPTYDYPFIVGGALSIVGLYVAYRKLKYRPGEVSGSL